nr:SPOR domain-containing protein [uncultured Roseobacter sp.]
MADIEFSHGMGAYGREHAAEEGTSFAALATMTHLAGAVVSLALIAGIGVWGYKLMVRDVSGIPVVRAAAGEMRVRPENPGGQLARHQGLAVNAIAAEGAATGPVDQVTLAPRDIDLAAEDQPIGRPSAEPITAPAPLAPAAEVIAAPDIDPATATSAAIDAVVAELALDAVAVAEPAAVAAAVKRPRLRPRSAAPTQTAAFVVETPSAEVDAAAIPAGTRLAQLGAFDSAEIARAEWSRLETRFGEYLTDKSRVVQQAASGGRTFYRLRAMGFIDLADARRFCSAFKAEGVDCIPVASK